MKIFLFDPPYDRLQGAKITPNYPLGLAYLAGCLNRKGHSATYINLDWDPGLPSRNPFSLPDLIKRYKSYLREIECNSEHPVWFDYMELLKKFKPDLIGITTSTLKIKSALKLLELTKLVSPEIWTVFGGHHSQIFAEELLRKVPELDFVVLGEGEIVLSELVGKLAESATDFTNIKGLVYRNRNGYVISNRNQPLLENLDELPFPDPVFYYANRRLIVLPRLALMASRGCPFQCRYCATNNIWKNRTRWRSPQNVIDEIRQIVDQEGTSFFNFYDDCFTLDQKWLLEFCDLLKDANLRINWQCITSANLVNETVFKKIIQAGCVKINIGVESGSERILHLARRSVQLGQIRKIFKLAKKHRISTSAYFMVGFPTETENDLLLTQRFIKEVRPDWIYCNVFIPLPGTDFYNWCVKEEQLDPRNAWRGDYLESPVMNVTGTLSDLQFSKLVAETFQISYRTNTRLRNLLRRIPLQQYTANPISAWYDVKRAAQYIFGRAE